MVGASKGPGRRLHFSKIRRVLQHIIKSTNPGKLLPESSFSIARAGGAVLPMERLPFGTSKVVVHAPNCISNCMVERMLTDNEMMDAYDLDLETQWRMSSFWVEHDTSPSYSFVNAVPIKVLREIASQLMVHTQPSAVASTEEKGQAVYQPCPSL